MLPSNMNLKIRLGTVGYNNKILVSDEKFSLGKNVEVNSLALEPASSLRWINLSLRFWIFSAELKSGFQFINNKLGFKPDQNSDA